MAKKSKKSSSVVSLDSNMTPDQHIFHLQQRIIALQEIIESKSNKLQRIQKRDIQFDKMNDKHANQIEQLDKQHMKEFEELEARHEEEVKQLEAKHESETDALDAEHRREEEDLNAKYEDIFSDDEEQEE